MLPASVLPSVTSAAVTSVCVEPVYDGLESFGTLSTGVDALGDSQEWVDAEEDVEWALD